MDGTGSELTSAIAAATATPVSLSALKRRSPDHHATCACLQLCTCSLVCALVAFHTKPTTLMSLASLLLAGRDLDGDMHATSLVAADLAQDVTCFGWSCCRCCSSASCAYLYWQGMCGWIPWRPSMASMVCSVVLPALLLTAHRERDALLYSHGLFQRGVMHDGPVIGVL